MNPAPAGSGFAAYVPWPLAAALGCAAGIACRQHAPGLVWWLFGCGAVVAAILLAATRSRRRPSRPGAPPWLPTACLVCLACFALGALRHSQWQGQALVLDGHVGHAERLHGTSDGRYFRITEPVRATLAVSPAGALPPGNAVVTGELALAPGRRNPGGFDYGAHLLARNVHGQLLVRQVHEHEPLRGVRERLRDGVRAGLGEREAALVEALSLGVRDELGELRESFALAGMAHLLALSGLHLGVIVLALRRAFRRFGPLRAPATLLLIVAYVHVTGATPSMLRAAIMAGALLLGEMAGTGRARLWTTMSLAAAATLLYRPAWLFDLGMQLSYGAVAGIALLAAPLGNLLAAPGGARFAGSRSGGTRSVGAPTGKPPPWWQPRTLVLGGLATSVAAQLPTVSLVAGTFGYVPLLAAFTNVIAVPLTALLVPLGNLAALAGLVSPWLAAACGYLTGPLARALIALAEHAERLPLVPWGEVGAAGHWFWLTGCAAVALGMRRALRPAAVLLVVLTALLASTATRVPQQLPELVAIDVGQGDAFLLRFPGAVDILVDAGGSTWSAFDTGGRVVVPALRALGVTDLDLVVSTHADADHAGGLPAVLAAFPVQALVIGHDEPGRETFEALMAAAGRAGVEVLRVRRGEVLVLGDVRLRVLNPAAEPSGDSNDDSVALGVWWRNVARAVLPGEVSSRTEAGLGVESAPVLVVPHHGSRFSSSVTLLRAVAGDTAVISVGRNSFGHPHPDVLARLAEAGYTVFTTLDHGAVRVSLGR